MIVLSKGLRSMFATVSLAGVALSLCLASGNRTSVGLLFVAIALGTYCRFGAGRMGLIVVAVSAIAGLCITSGAVQVGNGFSMTQLEQSRLVRTLNEREDSSAKARLDEAADAIAEIRHAGVPAIVLGFGPGATYTPHISLIERNLNELGTVHNIHITPIMLIYRYGVIGLLAFGLLIGLAIVVVRNCRSSRCSDCNLGEIALMLALPLYVIDMLFRNTTVDPVFAYALAACVLLLRPVPRKTTLPTSSSSVEIT
jgi:hypothetical protein